MITGRNKLGANGQFGASINSVNFVQNNITSPGNIQNLINDISELIYAYPIDQDRVSYFADLILDGFPDYYWAETWDTFINSGDNTIVKNKLDILIGAMLNAPENQLM